MTNDVSICNIYYMYVIFLIWQCPDIQVIAIHAVHKIDLGFRGKNENILVFFLSIHDRDICKLNNSASNLKQVKQQL